MSVLEILPADMTPV